MTTQINVRRDWPLDLLYKKVMRFSREHALFSAGDTLVVALSGGADSTALLDILAHLPGFDLNLVVAHLNHRLRGAESDADERCARAAAERYGCPCESVGVDVADLARERGLSLEEAGREARYAFLQGVVGKYAAVAVAVGHHLDDQAETVLMRLLRGAGGRGLAGMRPRSREGRLVRPLLCLRRQEIEAYLRQRGLVWCEDGSNRDAGFLRNRVRHELIPLLTTYNPGIVAGLNQTATLLAADEEVLDGVVAGLFARTVVVTAAGAIVDLAGLAVEPIGLRRRLYRLAIQAVKGDLRRIALSHLEAVECQAAAARPNSALALPDGITVIREYQRLRFIRGDAGALLTDAEVTLDRPGCYSLPCGGNLTLEECAPPAAGIADQGATVLCIPSGQLEQPLRVRYFRHGDRFVPLGMSGHKKLKDLFIDRKIPLRTRRQVPLLVAGETILWVCGVQAAAAIATATDDDGLSWLRLTYSAAASSH